MNEMEAAARTLSLQVLRLEIKQAEDIPLAIEGLKGRADALYACADSLVNANGVRIVTLALAAQLATIHYAREYITAGGLLSYGPDYRDLFRRPPITLTRFCTLQSQVICPYSNPPNSSWL